MVGFEVREECAGDEQQGIVHICIGDGGNRERISDSFADEQPPWSAFREASFGHGTLEIVNETHAEWIWYRNDASEEFGRAPSDSVWVLRGNATNC